MLILGISAFFHDSAACLIKDGEIVIALQEERFTRVKHDASFPKNAILKCIEHAEIEADEIDYFVFFEKPILKFERIFETYLATAPRGFSNFRASFPVWINEKLFLKRKITHLLQETLKIELNLKHRLKFSEHHLSHAASAFFTSPFDEAVILTIDGVGEWATTTVSFGKGNRIERRSELRFPHSLGLLYSAFTAFCGFKVNSGEYKLMGLAPYGDPKYSDKIEEHLIDIAEDGSFRLNMSYFGFLTDISMFNRKFIELFGQKPRSEGDPLEQFHMDLAASIQKVTEKIVDLLVRKLSETYSTRNICLAGGVALNCVANGKLLKKNYFEGVFIQPASGDAGGALGAALAYYHMGLLYERENSNDSDLMQGGLLGTKYSSAEIVRSLEQIGAKYQVISNRKRLAEQVAELISDGNAVGWMRGRMEFGPRALGARSILADPRNAATQRNLNLKIKFRESFRPFAPSVIDTELANWFVGTKPSPYMLFVYDVLPKLRSVSGKKTINGLEAINEVRSKIPAVTHVDYTARVQTVSETTNPEFFELLESFKRQTGCPILVNTSFNVRGEPIVESPEDAYRCFMGTNLDVLVLEDCILFKSDQPEEMILDYKDKFELD